MSKSVAHLLDAAITLAFLLAVLAGADLRWVLAIYLGLTFVGELCKALVAILAPLVDEIKRRRAA